jgi:hypothetical protein
MTGRRTGGARTAAESPAPVPPAAESAASPAAAPVDEVVGVGDAGRTDASSGERGAATAEYAIATMAAVAFAGLLVVILQSDEVRQILTDLVRQALTYNG